VTAVRAGFSLSQLLTDDELNELDDLCADYIDLRSENGPLKPFVYKMHLFTKTGSGQT
jgi:hypothetical protein